MLKGYRILETLYDGSRTLVFRGQRQLDQTPVVIKKLKKVYPSGAELVQFRNQYAITRPLSLPGIVQFYGLEPCDNGFALVMEDFGGLSLKQYVQDLETCPILPLTQFLDIALSITQSLEGLHAQRIIHKDLKPHNILIHPETLEVKLTDFSMASVLPRETQEIQNLGVLEGTLAYISPEQTGRMNRGIDYRTDFYSLGVTFFELLTGQLPFEAEQPIEWIHRHIAQSVPAVLERNADVPPMLSAIVAKLMAKNPEDRYQSALGLKQDLQRCVDQVAMGARVMFPLGQGDLCDRFVIPERLYGRDHEVRMLLDAFERVAHGGQELVLISGFSGIGKTAVISEVHKPIVRCQGYFVKGKFDQFQRSVPFSAFVDALRDLMGQILTLSPDAVQRWRTDILDVLGQDAQVIIDVIPELEQILGAQPPVSELSGTAAQNRFNRLFQHFVQIFATEEHPLVLFLDDLQWADLASLNLIQVLMSTEHQGHLLLMGAYRDNEVSPAHPLLATLRMLEQVGVRSQVVTLTPLMLYDLNQLVADTLKCPGDVARPLTQLIFQKTQGNPFFSTQFLKMLHKEGLVAYSQAARSWQCDLTQVRALALTDDVVTFVAQQIQKLPEMTRGTLQLAACIGGQFDLATLATVCEQSQAETAAALWPALQEGLILPQRETYKFYQPEQGANDLRAETEFLSEQEAPHYRFLHDRVQQAAYTLIPRLQRASTHLSIGRLLLAYRDREGTDEALFAIANQLNQGHTLIIETYEQLQLAQLNLAAGRKAKHSTAHTAALDYFQAGINLLPDRGWQQQYQLTLALYTEAVETAYLCGRYDDMDTFAEQVLSHAVTHLDTLKVQESRILSRAAQSQLVEAIEIALDYLAQLDVHFPEPLDAAAVQQGLQETAMLLANQSREELLDLPPMKDPVQFAKMLILARIWPISYLAGSPLVPLIVFRLVALTLRHGNSSLSAFGYVTYGVILCGLTGEIEAGYRFGQLSQDLLARYPNQELQPKILALLNLFIRHFRDPLRDTLVPMHQAHQLSLEAGDVEYAAYTIHHYVENAFFAGQELSQLEPEIRASSETVGYLQQRTILCYCDMLWQMVLHLTEPTEEPWVLVGAVYSEQVMQPQHLAANDVLALFYLNFKKLLLAYLFEQQDEALRSVIAAEPSVGCVTGMPDVPIFHFYSALVRLAVYPQASEADQTDLLAQVDASQTQLQHWANSAPQNHQHRLELICAERHRVLGAPMAAMEGYDVAIATAVEHGYLQDVALANELAARFYLAWGKEKIGKTYLIDAYYAYAHWGAAAKVEDLEKRYRPLLASILEQTHERSHSTETITALSIGTLTTSSTSTSSLIDLSTLIKASQTVSKEMHLDHLLSTLMQIVIENSGADAGALLLPEQHEQWILAVRCRDGKLLNHRPRPISGADVPETVIRHVERTLEPLILDNVTALTSFTLDPYIAEHCPPSVLSLPIQTQGKLVGIFYLENNLAAHAFRGDRLEMLKLLCAQAAISLKNASLYQASQDYAKQLEQSQADLLEVHEQLLHDAFHDLLTGLKNRACLMERLSENLLLSQQVPDYQYAILFLDLDQFKVVNDSLGHIVGDQLLQRVAERLQACLPHPDSIMRLGGDEFAVLIEDASAKEIIGLADRILRQFIQPFQLHQYEVFTGTSIGIARSTGSHYQSPEDMLRDADTALYRAKAEGRGCYAMFDPIMQSSATERLQLENELRHAIDVASWLGESPSPVDFQLNYQPIIALQTGQLLGFEALLRWHHPQRGWISPVKFIPIAEETGLIGLLGWWVLETACRQIQQWQHQFPQAASLVMNVNLSALQLQQPDFTEQLLKLLTEYHIDPATLKLEVTESCLLSATSSPSAQLFELRDQGVRLCIDDFGTGYSSLSRLHEFPIDTLKIDRAFVNRIEGQAADGVAVVQTILALAHSLDMNVVAEGIETEAQLEKLRTLGCESGQGYFFSKPVDSEAATAVIKAAFSERISEQYL
ncbi:Phytochrome-like protein cph2 [Acaryochloris thomasi RCC1774]|uniref:Phytochrome-like protein cph2 n=1 Tax=Acaryochloris thomasi RCC1774 TaxID=1764569 RepID=A0A2W1JLJ4_9CYAN|nr:Phytochrome-like protein cph2 [Acaryochloris thomasi RCC1774]